MAELDLTKTIDITLPRVACPRHGEPLRAQWPKGFLMFALPILQELLGREDFWDEIGPAAKGAPDGGKAAIEAALDRWPACERVGPATLMRLYEGCGVGVPGVCVWCMKARPGTPFKVSMSGGRVKTLRHVCFNCVVYRVGER